jgi:hypothetical protein
VWTNLYSFWDDLLDPLLVTFDGDNKNIIVNPIRLYANGQAVGTSVTIRAKQDIYSAGKRWSQRRRNLTYAQSMRSIGGDSVGSGQYAGDIYFATNSWRIVVNQQVNLTGIVYSDDYTTPYTVNAGGGVIATVSALAFAYNTTGVTVPTAAENAAAVLNANPASYGASTVGGAINTTNQTVANINTTTQNIQALTA